VAGALFSIALNPILFHGIEPLERRLRDNGVLAGLRARRAGDRVTLAEPERATLRQHAILAGYGRVGRMIGPALERRGFRYVVVTLQRDEVDALRARGVPAIYGDAGNTEVLELAHVEEARLVIVASSEANETRLIVDRVRELAPAVDLVVRTHSDTEAARLRALSSRIQAIHSERELAVQMSRYALRRFGVSATEAESIAQGLRGRPMVAAAGRAAGPTWRERLRRQLRRDGAPEPDER
jgi:CPA2 family monovalent cation:H+ antiporter-2